MVMKTAHFQLLATIVVDENQLQRLLETNPNFLPGSLLMGVVVVVPQWQLEWKE